MNKLKKIFAGATHSKKNKEKLMSTNFYVALPPMNNTSTTSPLVYDRSLQNFRLVWVDSNINEISNNDSINTVEKLRQIVNTLTKFIDPDECIEFIKSIKDEQIFMICSGSLGQTIVPVIHDIVQVNCIYIFCQNKTCHEQWAKDWSKIKGVYTNIEPICEALKDAAKDCDHNSVSISFVKKTDEVSKADLDSLDCSFMYTQMLKEILLTIDFEQTHIDDFLSYCQDQFVNNNTELRNIDKIAKEYHDHHPIWWYTYNCFLYSMLNRALRTMEIDLIIKMGFFLKDLHNHIAVLHSNQVDGHHHSGTFIVYRGQGLSQKDFNELKETEGGLLSFNNFLSTSTRSNISLNFVRHTVATSNLVGVFFVIEVDPTITSTPFANVKDVSYYQGEEEILFSMHSIFRIGHVQQIDGNNQFWRVDLTLTTDTDPQLHCLTERIREETEGSTGWFRLGKLMTRVAEYDKAEGLYNMLLPQTNDEREQGNIYYQLGLIMYYRGEYTNAISIYQKSLQLREKLLTLEHPDVAECYENTGLVYNDMGENSKALSSHETALEIRRKTLPANHPDLAASYNNIGHVYNNMGEYSKALSYYEKDLEITQKTLPANHPDLATSYNNIGLVYNNMGEFSKALSYYEEALEIYQKTLPANHPHLATSYNNIGSVYDSMEEYSKALSYYEKDLEITQKTLPANHPSLATSYNNIGSVYDSMGEYSKALSYYEKALEITQKTLPVNHPYLATSYNNIGSVYDSMEEYSKAFSYYEKALEIRQKSLPANHPSLATSYNNISSVYDSMGEYSKALSYYEKALEIFQKTLPANHPYIKSVKDSIIFVKKKL